MILLKVRRTASEPEPFTVQVNGQDLTRPEGYETVPARFATVDQAYKAAVRESLLREAAA